ncbi:MAG: DNA-deoxyinosine glycosylase [Lautropia sp.]
MHDRRARLLILGSFPGRASLRAQRYYAHPRNLFWPIVGALTGVALEDAPYERRLHVLTAHGIALWDVIARCDRPGSLDSAIRDAQHQTFEPLLAELPALQGVAFNGRLAASREPWFSARGLRTWVLPSTSPANAGVPVADKHAAWSVLAPLCRAVDDPVSEVRAQRARRPAPD